MTTLQFSDMNRFDRILRENPHFAAGRLEAEQEIAAGSLGYRLKGKAPDVTAMTMARDELSRRFGITLQVDGHCMVMLDDAAQAEGYNQRMAEEFESRIGENVIDDLFREVERKLKKRRNRG